MTANNTNINQKLSLFFKSGIYRFEDSNVVFIDSVRVLNLSYSHFRVSSSSYYSRFFEQNPSGVNQPRVLQNQRKRKRKVKKPRELNERELAADDRHQRAKPLLMKAHECLLGDNDILMSLGQLRGDDESTVFDSIVNVANDEQSFVDIGSVWQSKLFEICLYVHPDYRPQKGFRSDQNCEKRNVPAFESLVANETNSDMEADFLDRKYVMPKQSSFYMSDLKQINGLIPVKDFGFKLIVVDPPWENSSASQKSKYPTLPNRYFLSLPIQKLSHTDGALVALWVTNKEKLRIFVEKELFPKWGVKYMATHYWLKVKADGSLIGELDLFHHRPYECVVLGYYSTKDEDSEFSSKLKSIPDGQVFISIPGDYSRKPPIGELLQEYIPGAKPGHCIELFAREMLAGWTSWGNEPLRFQDSRYFSRTDQ
ncbi:methyltransferase-like protein 2 [Rutidosis leptorrhynchoides]|uniref:methyltransferase-like protein 2 n=1 Tax=Rutidosis leptorrhynchoides TaxID=125765 RepID=UPI003A9A5944